MLSINPAAISVSFANLTADYKLDGIQLWHWT